MTYSPESPNTVWAIVNHPDASTENGIFSSTDGGINWSPSTALFKDRSFRSILSHQNELWATSVRFEDQTGWIHHSSDSGLTWQEWSLDFTDYDNPPDVQILTSYTDGLWFRVTQTLKDELWNVSLTNGPSRVYRADTKIMNGALDTDGALYMPLWGQGIAKWSDETFTLLNNSPISYAVRESEGTMYLATRPLFSDFGCWETALSEITLIETNQKY